MSLRVAVYVVGAFCRPDFAQAVSGHVQIPLMTANILAELGHEVTIITTKDSPEHVILPSFLSSVVNVHTVINATRAWPQNGVRSIDALRQVFDIYQYLRTQDFDIIHFLGCRRTSFLAGLIKMLGVSVPVVLTSHILGAVKRKAFVWRWLGQTVDRVMALTRYTQRYLTDLGVRNIALTCPGIVKNLANNPLSRSSTKNQTKSSVLFWRNANAVNGADLCIEAFKQLSPRYPHVDFVFAVRPGDKLEQEVLAVSAQFENIRTYIYPYKEDGVTLDSLVQSAICAVFPFRNLSINPQMAILETLAAGCPVIATSIESNNEIVDDGETGLLIPPDSVESIVQSVEYFLADGDRAKRMGSLGAVRTAARWNWANYQQQVLRVYESVLDGADGRRAK